MICITRTSQLKLPLPGVTSPFRLCFSPIWIQNSNILWANIMCQFEFQNLSSYQLSIGLGGGSRTKPTHLPRLHPGRGDNPSYTTFLWLFISTFVPPLCIRRSPFWCIVGDELLWVPTFCAESMALDFIVRTACFQVRWKPFWLLMILMVSQIMNKWYLGKYSSIHQSFPYASEPARMQYRIRIVGVFFGPEAILWNTSKRWTSEFESRLDWICQSVFISSRSHIRCQGIHGIISLRSKYRPATLWLTNVEGTFRIETLNCIRKTGRENTMKVWYCETIWGVEWTYQSLSIKIFHQVLSPSLNQVNKNNNKKLTS